MIAGLYCCVCGSGAICAVRPGADAVYAPLSADAPTAANGVVVGQIEQRPQPDTAWCAAHWPWPLQSDVFYRTGGA